MRKLGLIGGMSWVSTETYYRIINQQIQKRVGGMCSAPLVVESLNFCDLSRIETDEQWAHGGADGVGQRDDGQRDPEWISGSCGRHGCHDAR